MDTRKAIIATLLWVVLAIVLAGQFWGPRPQRPSWREWADRAADSEELKSRVAKVKWRFATLAPGGVGWTRAFEEVVAPEWKKAFGNGFYIKTYCRGVMGDDADALRRMADGKLDAAGLSARGVSRILPEMAVLSLPFLIRDYDEADYLRERLSLFFDRAAVRRGYKILAWVDQGFDRVWSTKPLWPGPEAFHGAVFANWCGPLERDLVSCLGAGSVKVEPVMIPVELCPREAVGTANALLAPSPYIVSSQLYSCIKEVVSPPLRYGPALVVADLSAWEDLPHGYRSDLTRMRRELERPYCLRVREDEDKCLEAIIKYGVSEVVLTPEAQARLLQKLTPLWTDLAGELYPRKALNEVLALLQEYRKLPKDPSNS